MYRAVLYIDQNSRSSGKKRGNLHRRSSIARLSFARLYAASSGVALQMASHRERAVVKMTADVHRSLFSQSLYGPIRAP
jgi:hypothetical protein